MSAVTLVRARLSNRVFKDNVELGEFSISGCLLGFP